MIEKLKTIQTTDWYLEQTWIFPEKNQLASFYQKWFFPKCKGLVMRNVSAVLV